ncbi:MAG: DUF3592 domain-containing protein [Ruminococcus sp.]|nr:DUF3592 domain-containing protein [Ruminococcus sp.]
MDLEKILETGIVVFLVTAVAVLLFIILCIVIKGAVEEKRKRSRCTERVVAEVINFTDVAFYEREEDRTYYKTVPVYEYSYKGEFCRCTGGFSSSWRKKKPEGAHVELLVDPDNPKSFICPEEERNGRIQAIKWICIFVGAVLMFVIGTCLTVSYLKGLSEF